MLHCYATTAGYLHAIAGLPDELSGVVWIDLLRPDDAERAHVEAALGVRMPTRAEIEEIEVSSRLYYDGDVPFMTVIVPADIEGQEPALAPVTFILTPTCLVTLRYHEPRAFATFPPRAQKAALGCDDATGVLMALLEAVVDRLADILELAGGDVDGLSRLVLTRSSDAAPVGHSFKDILRRLGHNGDLNSKVRDSLMSLERLTGFLAHVQTQRGTGKEARARLKTLARDVASLTEHAGFLSQKITFLLDATLGLIGIEQNDTIKIFSVVAFVFLPPTLIASIYGMNFDHMPELDWLLGYPAAIGLMIVSAILPYLYFKRRGWL